MGKRFRLGMLVLLVASACQTQKKSDITTQAYRIFEKIDPKVSGVDFTNNIQENVATQENLLDYDYFYNGAGVAACDIDNDGLPDLFFSANQVENKLYRNLGNFRFEDISEKAGINIGKSWSNGVTFADVNQDGWVDIYVAQGGPSEPQKRKNLLYINQQDLTFRELALEYGLDDEGISTQAAFFDYDRDGDQDCFVINESELYGFDPITFHRRLQEDPNRYQISFSHLYENKNGKYIDVSLSSGIIAPTFGLGLAIADINEDGWLDIYIANDYYLPDNLYINKKDGSFSDRANSYLGQMSFFGMGVDIADVNNDTHQDIFVLDMASKDHVRSKTLMASMNVENFSLLVDHLGYPHQYMFNSLQLNDGMGRFNNVAQLAGLAKTDWSWAALINDYDLDGHKDVFVTNGYRRYALDNDFKQRVRDAKKQYDNKVPLEVKQALYNSMPTEALPNLMYQNLGDLTFADVSVSWGLEDPTYSNGAATVDLDLDGDLDLVINNIDQPAAIYQNQTVEHRAAHFLTVQIKELDKACFAKVTIVHGGQKQLIETKITRGYRSAMPPTAVFGLGTASQVDTCTIEFSDGKTVTKTNIAADQTLSISYRDARDPQQTSPKAAKRLIAPYTTAGFKLDYRHQQNPYNDFAKEILLPQKQSTLGPGIGVADVNQDQRDDLWASGGSGQAASLYLQNEDGTFSLIQQPAFQADKNCEDLEALFFDLDQDGDLDLLVVSGGNNQGENHPVYQHRLYINDGQGLYARKPMPALDKMRYSGKTVKGIDFDLDGDTDILIGNRIIPQSYPVAAPSFLYENRAGILIDVTQDIVPGLQEIGIVNDISVSDINQDGKPDFITVGEWTGIRVFINMGNRFETPTEYADLLNLTGWWFSIHQTDINQDGLPDFLVGNVGTNLKHKASLEKPFKIFANDFDESGSLDIVLSNEYQGHYVPSRGRECSSQQMPMISEKFQSYASFANATLADVYGEDQLAAAYAREATTFKSMLLMGNPDGGFTRRDLPPETQQFPLLDAIFVDLNEDGHDDAIMAGCIYETEVETPRLDAGHGMVLMANRAGHYAVGKCPDQCLYIPGNVKTLSLMHIKDEPYLVCGKNNDVLSLFKLPTRLVN